MRVLRVVAVLLGLRLISCAACAARDDSAERLDYVMKRLKSESPGSGLIDGEWYLVSLSMAGLAARQLGRTDDLKWLTARAAEADVDSGPLIFGLSPSGTGFAIAGAKARGGLLRTAEAAGLTVPWGGPHYLLAPLVGEAAVLAAKTL